MSSAWLPIRTVNLMGAPPDSWLDTISIGRSPSYFSFNNRVCHLIAIPWAGQLKTVKIYADYASRNVHGGNRECQEDHSAPVGNTSLRGTPWRPWESREAAAVFPPEVRYTLANAQAQRCTRAMRLAGKPHVPANPCAVQN